MKQLRTWVTQVGNNWNQHSTFFFLNAAVSHCMLKKLIYYGLNKLGINDLKLKLHLLG
jgi:hypothetical protein